MIDLPFADSRRLTGANLYFLEPGALLETAAHVYVDDRVIDAWRERIEFARNALSWPAGPIVARIREGNGGLAFAAPIDQLFVATEVNEWAFLQAFFSFSPREKVSAGRMREKHSDFYGSEGKLPFDEETLAFVRNLRRSSTDAEQLIWMFVRNRRLHGQKFRRQYAVDPYVLDFYCHDLKLAIELDGGQHNEAAEKKRDARRDASLVAKGIKVLRYWNDDLLRNTEQVLSDIWTAVDEAVKLCGVPANSDALPSSALRAPSPDGEKGRLISCPRFSSDLGRRACVGYFTSRGSGRTQTNFDRLARCSATA